ncbi:MAG: cell wall-binding protein [Clostridiales bacterium]|nr:cell wall-binding protein [Clostridiales bacterium]
MKRRRFVIPVLAATLAFASPAVCAFAAGWVSENGSWVYYSESGARLTDSWVYGADSKLRWLDSTGTMAVNSWVDDNQYFVDENGLRVTNTWLKKENTSAALGYDYYYCSSTGKVVTEDWCEIDGSRYYFDENGIMQTGWILDDMYYCAEDGKALTGWQRLYPPDYDEDTVPGPESDYDDGKELYYFSSTGKKQVAKDSGDNVKQKKINGVWYCIDEDGAFQTGWVCVTGDESDDIEDYRMVDEDGVVKTGWYAAEPPENLQSNYRYEVEWFYFDSKGEPYVGPEEGSATKSDFKKISGKSYLFNDYGTPVYGIQRIYGSDDDEVEYTAYYFGTRDQSCLQKSGIFTIDEGGESRQYYFNASGKGLTGVYENHLYYMGRLQKADSGSKYEVFTIPSGNGEKNYVVNTSGKIMKSTTVKDATDTKYKTNSSGILIEIDDEETDGGYYTSPEEPDWEAFDWK